MLGYQVKSLKDLKKRFCKYLGRKQANRSKLTVINICHIQGEKKWSIVSNEHTEA